MPFSRQTQIITFAVLAFLFLGVLGHHLANNRPAGTRGNDCLRYIRERARLTHAETDAAALCSRPRPPREGRNATHDCPAPRRAPRPRRLRPTTAGSGRDERPRAGVATRDRDPAPRRQDPEVDGGGARVRERMPTTRQLRTRRHGVRRGLLHLRQARPGWGGVFGGGRCTIARIMSLFGVRLFFYNGIFVVG